MPAAILLHSLMVKLLASYDDEIVQPRQILGGYLSELKCHPDCKRLCTSTLKSKK